MFIVLTCESVHSEQEQQKLFFQTSLGVGSASCRQGSYFMHPVITKATIKNFKVQ